MSLEEPTIPISMDLRYTLRATKALLRSPSAVTRLLGGPRAIDKLLQEEYSKRRVLVKRTHGFDIRLNPEDMGISPSIAILGWYELRTTELFIRLLREGCKVVDVGSNIGFFTLLAAGITGNDGIVVSFEPDPTSFSLLSESIEINRFGNVKLLRQCVSNVDGTRTLHLSATQHKGLHTIVSDLGGPKIAVPSVRLDTVLPSLGVDKVDLLKIDVEGAEAEVLEGTRGLLGESRITNIIMEWEHPQTWARHKDLLNLLLANFEIYQIARSLPFLPITKMPAKSFLMPLSDGRFGTNLYLRQRK